MDPETKGTACAEFEMLLEDSIEGPLEGAEAKALAVHMAGCANCRAALEDARATSRLLSFAEPTPDPGPQFTHLVMARVRTEAQADGKSLWRLVAAFARPFALSATVALGLMLAYGAYWAPNPVNPNTGAAMVPQADVHELISDPSAPPATLDDTLMMMVADNDHGK